MFDVADPFVPDSDRVSFVAGLLLPAIHRATGRFPPDCCDTIGRLWHDAIGELIGRLPPDCDLAPGPTRQPTLSVDVQIKPVIRSFVLYQLVEERRVPVLQIHCRPPRRDTT